MTVQLRSLKRLFPCNIVTWHRGMYARPTLPAYCAIRHVRHFSERPRAVFPPSYNEQELEVVESIKVLIEKRIKPVVQQDGGDLSFLSYDPTTGTFVDIYPGGEVFPFQRFRYHRQCAMLYLCRICLRTFEWSMRGLCSKRHYSEAHDPGNAMPLS